MADSDDSPIIQSEAQERAAETQAQELRYREVLRVGAIKTLDYWEIDAKLGQDERKAEDHVQHKARWPAMLSQRKTPRQTKGEQPEQTPGVPQPKPQTQGLCQGKGSITRVVKKKVLGGLYEGKQCANEEDQKNHAVG